MPFHHNRQPSHNTGHQSAAQGLLEAAQTLGSIGAPTGNLRTAALGTTAAGTDAFLPSNSASLQQFDAAALPPPQSAHASSRRADTIGRMADHPSYQQSSRIQEQSSQGSMYNNPPPSTNSVPGSLQPGATGQGRPVPMPSAYTAPTAVPQINTNASQYSLPTRSNTMHSHSHSRSSPAGLDQQKYVPFASSGSDPQKFPQTPQQQKYYSPTTPTVGHTNSPLALDQIRPRANSNLPNDELTGTTLFGDLMDKQPTNSNYLAPWSVFAFDWCKYPVPQGNSAGKMAIGSYLEDPHNYITILDTQIVPQESVAPGAPSYGLEYTRIAEATCAYPVTRILWEPPIAQKQSTDLLATSGDHLRLWSLPQSTSPTVSNTITRSSSVNQREQAPPKLTPLALLSNSKTPEHTAPLTSLDWNTLSPKLIITSSIDTTCTIWDIPTLTAKTQLIAHDKEVFDVRFCAGSVDVFVSCGADGSVRMFDLRSLEHSTIIYEPAEKKPESDKTNTPPSRMSPTRTPQTLTAAPPLLRLATSPHDSHLLATFAADSNIIRILDVRQPGQALLELRGHSAALNAVEWSPSRRGMIASGADDSLVLVWDLLHSQNGAIIAGESNMHNGTTSHNQHGSSASNVSLKGPASSWSCDYEVSNLSWAPQSMLTGQGGEWVGVAGGRGVWGVKV
ncbi:uncharacterized protein PV09_02052 [Verruconis gallopava]|uniref:Uncharacterized protein n=1 Tax=Verruconis gallopava TaxID=253628 RepID=A0A0D1XWM1_9PEZI|nr:uncharacterized protein PV09_02052 [Verruconis gallopava]KIW07186.1 hypothetical protein PV09_02052 [Verruconis gallopava]